MAEDRFTIQDRRIERLERFSAGFPTLYRVALVSFALFGWVMLGLMLFISGFLALACLLLMVLKPNVATIKIGILVGLSSAILAWSILRSLWVRMEPPEGQAVTRDQAPALFQEIDDLVTALRAPRIHRVVVSGELNAAMAQVPRFGIFGGYGNHLILGLPLLRCLSPGEARSVIAHELGHALGGHGRLGAWIYRLRTTWSGVATRVASQGGSRVVGAFLRWYVPRFDAWSFIQVRRQEYEADQAACRSAGTADAANALIRISAVSRHLAERFWPSVHRLVPYQPEPLPTLQSSLHEHLVGTGEFSRWLAEAWARPTDRLDTHPALRDRVMAMTGTSGATNPSLPPPIGTSAATLWLGGQETLLAERLDQEWSRESAPAWRERHAQEKSQVATLAALKAREVQDLSPEERWTMAELVSHLEGDVVAAPLIDVLADLAHPMALLHRARRRLGDQDEGGLADLQRAVDLDPRTILPACGLAREHLLGQGRSEEAVAWEKRARIRVLNLEQAEMERSTLPKPDRLGQAKPEPEHLARLSQAIAGHPEIAGAWLCRVNIQHCPELPWHLLVVQVQVPWWKFRGDSANAALSQTIAQAFTLPLAVTVYVANGKHELTKAARNIGIAIPR